MRHTLRSLLRHWKFPTSSLLARHEPATVRTAKRRVQPRLTILEDKSVPSGSSVFVPQGLQFGAIGDYVFFDFNQDGLQDVSEFGLPNQTVNLLDGQGSLITSTTTDANGLYAFLDLTAGDYIVEFLPMAGFTISPQNVGGNPAIDSDPDPTTGRTSVIPLAAGEFNLSVDCGLTKPTSVILGDFVWIDANCDGLFDQTESGFADATVNLLDSNGMFLTSTKTDSNGSYLFSNVAPGTYQIEFVLPSGYTFSPANQGMDDQIDSDADQTTGRTQFVTLAAGQADMSLDAGLCPIPRFKLGDLVWFDTNCDGIYQQGEPGVANIPVELLDANGNLLDTTITEMDGKYLFEDLEAGTYNLRFILQSNLAFTQRMAGMDGQIDSDVFPETGETGNFQLMANDLTRDAGVVVLKGISGFVYVDANNNGVFEPGELPLQGVEITISGIDDLGNFVSFSTKTDILGEYLFVNLRPGNYDIVETQPDCYLDGKDTLGTPFPGVAGEDKLSVTIDCDLNNIFGINYNFGEIPPSSLRGKVFFDINNDGIPDFGEPGINGTVITLTGTDDRGGSVFRQMVTGADGTYMFSGLRPGTYALTETQPPPFLDGKDRVGSAGGVLGNDGITDIPLPVNVDAFAYDFGEILSGVGKFGKEELLATHKTVLGLAAGAFRTPTSPSFANSVNVTQLSSTSQPRFLVTAPDAGFGPEVKVYDYSTGNLLYDFLAYDASYTGGVRVAVGDVTGDGIPDIITAPGVGGQSLIRVFDGTNGNLVSEFNAYDPIYNIDVYIAVGNTDGGGAAEIITGAGQGGGSHVKVFDGAGGLVRQFFAYDPFFTGGVRVASGDTNDDGFDDIITAAGPGGGPHVKIFGGLAVQGLLGQYFAYDAIFTGGVYVAAGDTDGDGNADVITGAGQGGGAHVKVFSSFTQNIISQYFAYEPSFGGGVRVGALDINGDCLADVITSTGPGLPTYTDVRDVTRAADLDAFIAFDRIYTGGTFVGGGM